jgi:hydroxypyruvate isomerase
LRHRAAERATGGIDAHHRPAPPRLAGTKGLWPRPGAEFQPGLALRYADADRLVHVSRVDPVLPVQGRRRPRNINNLRWAALEAAKSDARDLIEPINPRGATLLLNR